VSRLIDLLDHALDPGVGAPAGAGRFAAIEIAGLTADSRQVEAGFLFAALPGVKQDGAEFIAEAIGRGAVAVLALPGTRLPAGSSPVALIEDALPRRRFARIAAGFFGVQPPIVAAVTGTSGKSSTVSFARQLWQALGEDAASLGTLGIESAGINRHGSLTTADPVALHGDLAALARAGVTRVAMEASSHGLDQYRLDGVAIAAAGFTGFGRDHLDYHATSDAYLAAKRRLLTELLPPGRIAVLNADMPEFAALERAVETAGRRVMSFGHHGNALRILTQTATPQGQTAALALFGQRFEVALPLVGGFQLMNALCALGLVLAAESGPLEETTDRLLDRLVAGLGSLTGVRGRLEHVATLPNGASVYVDYAHKPDAIAAVLEALRPHATGQLIIAFGCGGDRDAGKRPLMGEIASRLADRVIVTDDNPRSEDPASIRAAILAAASGAIEIADRAEAIRFAVGSLAPGDLLVVAGKGHEQGQIVGSTVRPFDDAAVVRAAVAEVSA
jgi:UDP-N-acetylmuramoyl-L-alanyl-D-glutamate--2,6-diaminopimelate ligase